MLSILRYEKLQVKLAAGPRTNWEWQLFSFSQDLSSHSMHQPTVCSASDPPLMVLHQWSPLLPLNPWLERPSAVPPHPRTPANVSKYCIFGP